MQIFPKNIRGASLLLQISHMHFFERFSGLFQNLFFDWKDLLRVGRCASGANKQMADALKRDIKNGIAATFLTVFTVSTVSCFRATLYMYIIYIRAAKCRMLCLYFVPAFVMSLLRAVQISSVFIVCKIFLV